MATAKKLKFQAERKAAAWQGGKPQPAPLPADVHAATCLVDSDGEAARTAYPVFPGIEIAYHDVHAASAATQRVCAAGCLEIHHCREGRIAYPYGDACFFLAPGDLAIVQRAAEAVPVRFPTGHYHGITVTIDRRARRTACRAFWRMSRCGRVRSSKNSVRTVPALSRARLRAWRTFSLSSTPCRRASARATSR